MAGVAIEDELAGRLRVSDNHLPGLPTLHSVGRLARSAAFLALGALLLSQSHAADPAVVSFTLVNTETGQPVPALDPLPDDAVVDLGMPPNDPERDWVVLLRTNP